MKFKPVICLVLIFSTVVRAQSTSSEIKLGLKKLGVIGSVLYIAAHPDDENTKLLAYLSKEKLYRTGYLSLTRGDGGQNLIGNEQGDLLGLIRTQELLGARKIDGAEQFFSSANDFGFSKTPEESLKFWDKEKILSDVVWVIRKFRPDVIITRFPGDARAGHGQHAASSILAQEAYSAAGDPKRFPEQLKFVKTWQAKRILWNTFNFGSTNTTAENQLKLNIGSYNALLGKSYGEIAADSRTNHKSQGMGTAPQRGQSIEYFSLWQGDLPKTDLMEGVETSWKRLPDGDKIDSHIAKINAQFDLEHPENSVESLVSLLSEVENISDTYWRTQKAAEIKELIKNCTGIYLEANSPLPMVAQNDSILIATQTLVRAPIGAKLINILTSGSLTSINDPLIANKSLIVGEKVNFSHLTQPYWLEDNHPIGYYQVKNLESVGYPENPDYPSVSFKLQIAGKEIVYSIPITSKYTDQVRGELFRPLTITPPITVSLDTKVLLIADEKPRQVMVRLRSFKPNLEGFLSLNLPLGWDVNPKKISFKLDSTNTEIPVAFTITPTKQAQSGLISATANLTGQTYSKDIKTIQYAHIPAITLFPNAEAKLIKLDLKLAGKRIGYLPGAGDLIPETLTQIGYQVTTLTENDIENEDLSKYDAVVTGVRFYNVNQKLKAEQAKLLKYVENGGNLVVQYNVNKPLVLPQIGPYPFNLTTTRVTDEDAPVTILKPESKLLNFPNKITKKDFDGWIQERGIYFASNLDNRYETVLAMNDPNEKSLDNSLFYCNFGKGRFVYTSLVFFRELPAGIPGAYRLFVNLLSK